MLAAAGVAAAGGLVLAGAKDDLAQKSDPQVEDRGSASKITALRAMPVGTKAFVKIETNMMVVGWGKVTGSEPKVACALT